MITSTESYLAEEIYRLCAEGNEQKAIEYTLADLELSLRLNAFALVDTFLAALDLNRVASGVLLSILTITAPASDFLHNRYSFFSRAQTTLQQRLGSNRTTALLTPRK